MLNNFFAAIVGVLVLLFFYAVFALCIVIALVGNVLLWLCEAWRYMLDALGIE